MDNFESGLGTAFGIVYLDYATQARIHTASAAWYQQVDAANVVVEQDA